MFIHFFLSFSLCIFCGKKDASFTEDGLDLHYWKHCPMLRRCDECRQVDTFFFKSSTAVQSIPDALLCLTAGLCCPQVVEIASLTEHLLGECDSRSKFKQCPRCCEAVAADHLPRHVQSPGCNRESTSRKSGLTGHIRGIVACALSFVTGEIIFKLKPI